MLQPEIAVLISTFERPGHLARVLASIAAQEGVRGAFEVVVTDDGSRDHTERIVRQFAANVDFPVQYTTHARDGFQLARCRNEGVAASTAPYLLFLDGDCVIPPDHLRTHLDRRSPGFAMAGYCMWLNREISERLTEQDIHAGRFVDCASWRQRSKIAWRHFKASFYSAIGDSTRPKLAGGNIGIARADYQRVNGYDENFRGWGCEDDDLRLRLRAAGVGVQSISWWTNTYHLWHPRAASAPKKWRDGSNVEYLNRRGRLTRCLSGLAKRRLQDLSIRIVGHPPRTETMQRFLPRWCRVALSAKRHESKAAELELAFAPGGGQFSQTCDCRVLIIPPGLVPGGSQARSADLIFVDRSIADTKRRLFSLNELESVLEKHLGAWPTASQQFELARQAA